jgi:hypothetical protein
VRRTTLGFDTVDLVLDLVVAADGTWSLKDEDDFELAASVGQLQHRAVEQVRAAAEQMISVVESGGPPFNETHWLSWRHRRTGPFLRCPRVGLLADPATRAQGSSSPSLPVLPG